jgi:hypothetical protein
MRISELGDCTYDEVYRCYSSELISLPVLSGAECRILVEGYEDDSSVEEFHEAIKNFLAASSDVLKAIEPYLFKYYLDVKSSIEPEEDFPSIGCSSEIWQHIHLGKEAVVSRRPYGDRGIYVSLGGNCDWEPEHGLQIVFKNGSRINKVGPYDGHLTNSDAYADSALEGVIYR